MSMQTIMSLEPKLKDRLTNVEYEWNKLDYTHDVIFEASAGTGKTYALESIVMKLILEKDVNIRNILIVTYTEKAAGELKDRVRSALSAAQHLPDDFDEATICTIHSFCRELLTEYAFENRVPIKTDIASSDNDLIHRAVRAVLTDSEFLQSFGKDYGAYVLDGGYKSTAEVEAAAESRLKDICGEKVALPQCESGIDELMRNVENAAKNIISMLDGKTFYEWALSGFDLHGSDRGGAESRFMSLSSMIGTLADLDSEAWFSSIQEWQLLNGSAKNAFNPRVKGHRNGDRLQDLKPELKSLIDALSQMANVLKTLLIDKIVNKAFAVYKRLKAESAVMTFDDMVAEASKVIAAQSKDSPLLKSIRHKYRIALVDEFQDTDAKQWNIFKKIFSSEFNLVSPVDPKPQQGFLLVVGDPKQAIYSFRGADINTYLAARDEITDADANSKYKCTLGHTYRSTPQMVEAFNAFFSASGWFDQMGYSNVGYAKGGDFKEYEDNPQLCPPVALLESVPRWMQVGNRGGFGNNKVCLPTFVGNAAQTIRRLMASPSFPIYDKKTKTVRTQLQLGDFCFLVRGNTEATIVKRVLSAAKIPFGHYKEGGLFATAEAESVKAFFDFLGNPGDRGTLSALLLTPFFAVHPAELEARLNTIDPAFNNRVDRWLEMTRRKEWNELCESALNDTRMAHPARDDYEYDRRLAAIRQIFDKLLVQLGRSARTVSEFSELLRAWGKDDSKAQDGGTLRQRESDANRVQIMTMHASKGLEFPVVFLAGGLSPIDRKEMTEEERESNRQEVRRLIYVAITRAKYRVYLPWTKRPEGFDGIGSSGSALRKGFLADGIKNYFGSAENACANTVDLSQDVERPIEVADVAAVAADEVRLSTVYQVGYLKHLKMQWDSYSSLAHHGVTAKVTPITEGEHDERPNGSNSDERKEESLLPKGATSGDVFHEIMETLCNNDETEYKPGFKTIGEARLESIEADFADDIDSPFVRLVRRVMRKHAISNQVKGGDSTERTIARMVWNALNTPISVGGSEFLLKDIAPADRRAELEFVIDEATVLGAETPQLGGRVREGCFNGKIDLLVRPKGADGKVIVIDWKTNSLAEFNDGAVTAAMVDCGYDLQYKLYSLAVSRWLGAEKLGGVAYLFVRGGEKAGMMSGVFARSVDAEYMIDCHNTICEIVQSFDHPS